MERTEPWSKPRYSSVSSAHISPDDTEVMVWNGDYFDSGAVVINMRTGEDFVVLSVAGDILTVKRGVASNPCEMRFGDETLICGYVEDPL